MAKIKAIVMCSYYIMNEIAAIGITGINLVHVVIKLKSTAVRCLGVKLDSMMNFEAQVASIRKRVYSLLYRLYLFKKPTGLNLRKHSIETLIFLIVDYCSLMWFDISNELNGKIQVEYSMFLKKKKKIVTILHHTGYRFVGSPPTNFAS